MAFDETAVDFRVTSPQPADNLGMDLNHGQCCWMAALANANAPEEWAAYWLLRCFEAWRSADGMN